MNDLLNFFDSIITIDDRESLIADIEAMKKYVFSVDSQESLEKILNENLSQSRASEFFKFLGHNNRKIQESHIVEEILESLRLRLINLEVATLHLAIELDKNELHALHRILVAKLKEHVLIQTTVNPALIGGCTLEFKGVFLDLSLATTIRKLVSQPVITN